MALSVIGAATQGTTNGVATTPTGAASGDLLLFFVTAFAGGGATSVTPPAGATLVWTSGYSETGGGGVTNVWCYKLVVSGAPAATYTFTLNPAAGFGGSDVACICIRGEDTTTPIDSGAGAPTTANASAGQSATITAPGLTTSHASELLVWFWWGNDNALATTPTGFTQQINANSVITSTPEALFTKSQATAAATGAVSATTGGSDDWIVGMLAVVPAGAASTQYPFGMWLQ